MSKKKIVKYDLLFVYNNGVECLMDYIKVDLPLIFLSALNFILPFKSKSSKHLAVT